MNEHVFKGTKHIDKHITDLVSKVNTLMSHLTLKLITFPQDVCFTQFKYVITIAKRISSVFFGG